MFSINFFEVAFLCAAVIFLVLFKLSHPLGPIVELNTAGFGPGAVYVEPAMPLELPQLLKTNSSDGPIHEKLVYKRVVSVDGEVHHFAAEADPLTIVFGWNDAVKFRVEWTTLISTIARPASSPHGISEDRCEGRTFDVFGPPVPCSRSVLNHPCARRWVINPVVSPIAGFFTASHAAASP